MGIDDVAGMGQELQDLVSQLVLIPYLLVTYTSLHTQLSILDLLHMRRELWANSSPTVMPIKVNPWSSGTPIPRRAIRLRALGPSGACSL